MILHQREVLELRDTMAQHRSYNHNLQDYLSFLGNEINNVRGWRTRVCEQGARVAQELCELY